MKYYYSIAIVYLLSRSYFSDLFKYTVPIVAPSESHLL